MFKPSRRRFITGILTFWSCILVLAAWNNILAGENERAGLSRTDFLRLKSRFETLTRKNSDPEVLSCLAMETTALAWTLAAANLTEDAEARAEWQERAVAFEKSWAISEDWKLRQQSALRMYYEAMREIALFLVSKNKPGRLASDLNKIMIRARQNVSGLNNHPDFALERLALSGNLVNMAAMIVRSLGNGTLDRPVELILQDMLAEAEATRRRGDIHYRAKLALLYASNIQGLTDLIFLMALPAGPPLSQDLALIHGNLNKSSDDRRLTTSLSLTWIAQTQATLPLAYWVTTQRPRKN
jgi:hypothetical protein